MKSQAPVRLAEGGAQTPDDHLAARLLEELPKDIVSDLAVARVWRNLTREPEPRQRRLSRRLAAGGLTTVTCVAMALVVTHATRPAPAEIVLTSGGVFFGEPARPWVPGDAGQQVKTGERVLSDASGMALLRIPGVATAVLGPASDVAVDQLSHGTVLRLSRGSMTARVQKRPPGQPFIVETDRYTVRVVGTLFTVIQSSDGNIAVSVREGTVEVLERANLVARVTAGHQWTSTLLPQAGMDNTSDLVAGVLEETLKHGTAEQVSDRFRSIVPAIDLPHATTATRATDPAGALETPARDRSTPPALRLPPPARTHAGTSAPNTPLQSTTNVAAQPASPAPAVTGRTEVPLIPIPAAVNSAEPARASVLASAAAPSMAAPTPAASPPTAAPSRTNGDGGPMARARRFQDAGDFRSAVDAYEQISDSEAIFQAARLSETKLKDLDRALRSYERYEASYPHGDLLLDAELNVLKIKLQEQRSDEVVALATQFMRAHPNDDRVEEVRFARGTVYREMERYAEAMADYRSITKPSLADDAAYGIAVCQRGLGDRASAAQTLRDYLARFPKGQHVQQAKDALSGH